MRLARTTPSNPTPAPVILFAYARPDHLRRTLDSLRANPEAASTRLTVYCDAPKRPEHQGKVNEVRTLVDSIAGFAEVRRVYRTANLGLARSIIEGVTESLRDSDRVIVLEDDLELSPHFLRYMNDGLDCYLDDERVASIHGYSYPTGRPLPETFFLKGADCWGWATWARAWSHFEPDGRRLLAAIRSQRLGHEFDYDGNYPHLRILKNQVAGRNDSWAIRWHASCYLAGKVSLYPSVSLVDNIGHDDSGTHCAAGDSFSARLADRPIRVERIESVPSPEARAAVVDFFRSRRRSTFRKVLDRLERRLSRRHATAHS